MKHSLIFQGVEQYRSGSRSAYKQLPTVCDQCGDSHRARGYRLSSLLPWALSILLLVGWIWTVFHPAHHSVDGYWRAREFDTVKVEIPAQYTDVQYSAVLRFNGSHHVYRPTLNPDYVGTPSQEIDDAWERLIGASHVFISPEEAKSFEGELWQEPDFGLHTAHVTVFHDLHCVNMIRKALHLDHYPEMRNTALHDHIGMFQNLNLLAETNPEEDHCIDALRESLMCTGEMTLIPVRWSENRSAPNPDFATTHTCRDYEALRQWALSRDVDSPARYPENARRLRLQWGLDKEDSGTF